MPTTKVISHFRTSPLPLQIPCIQGPIPNLTLLPNSIQAQTYCRKTTWPMRNLHPLPTMLRSVLLLRTIPHHLVSLPRPSPPSSSHPPLHRGVLHPNLSRQQPTRSPAPIQKRGKHWTNPPKHLFPWTKRRFKKTRLSWIPASSLPMHRKHSLTPHTPPPPHCMS